jgi:hypothetical protein
MSSSFLAYPVFFPNIIIELSLPKKSLANPAPLPIPA